MRGVGLIGGLEIAQDLALRVQNAAAEQGLHGVHLAESVDGQGFGLLELAIVVAEFGYGAVPGPFVPSAIASALIAAHDPGYPLLTELAAMWKH